MRRCRRFVRCCRSSRGMWLVVLTSLIASGATWAAPIPNMGGIVAYSNFFGSPSALKAKRGSYLETALALVQSNDAVVSGEKGRLLFEQRPSALSGNLPGALGGIVALMAEDGLTAVLSGKNFLPARAVEADYIEGQSLGALSSAIAGRYGYDLRIYDAAREQWINPLLLSNLAKDETSPRIESLVLRGQRMTAQLKSPAKGKMGLLQGGYTLFVRAVDPAPGGIASGVFRYKVLLDGLVVADKKMDAALVSGLGGLSFAGLAVPSSENLDEDGRLGIGKLELLRGQHLLELFVLDCAGNQAKGAWPLSVQ